MRFLVTTDGSERSFRVFAHAKLLAEATGAEIVLLHVLDPRLDAAQEVDTDLRRASERVAARWQEDLAEYIRRHDLGARPRVEVKGRREATEDAILRVAEEEGAALIAMDTHGTSALRHALVGSIATGVIGKGLLPVMLTGDHALSPERHERYRLVLTTDGSPASMDIVTALKPVLEAASPEITLVRVFDPRAEEDRGPTAFEEDEAELERVAATIPGGPVEAELVTLLPLETPPQAIVREAVDVGANAIAMSTHGYSVTHHLLAGSVAMEVLRHSPVPVIMARPRRE